MERTDENPKPKRTSRATAKVTALALFAAVAVLFIALVTTEGSDEIPPASAVASAEFTLDSGDTATLTDFQGEPVVLNFFASWCAPCRAELPDFEAVHNETKDEVTFLGINHDSNEQSWLGFVEETDVTFQTAFQPGQEIWSELDALSLPSTAFVASDGSIQHVHSGVLDQTQLRDLINTHLTEST